MKLYVSDLDGTLLKWQGVLSDFSRSALNRLIREGLQFTVASARSGVTIRRMLDGLDLKLPVIEFNGAFLSDFRTGRHLVINPLKPEMAREAYEAGARRQVCPFVSSFNGREDCLYHPEKMNEGMDWYYRDRWRVGDPRLRKREGDIFRDQVVCLTFIQRKEKLLPLAAEMQEAFPGEVEIQIMENPYSPGWFWLTVHDRKATKDQALKRLMQDHGFKREDLTVFGDNTNDIKMFQFAATALAVANAAEELKPYATGIIGSNEEDAVVRYILQDCGFPGPGQGRAPQN